MNSSINHKIFNHIPRSPNFFSKNKISFMSRKGDGFFLGFIVPRSLGSAVFRNRFKRRCRASLLQLGQQGLLPSRGVVIKPKNLQVSYHDINESARLWVDTMGGVKS